MRDPFPPRKVHRAHLMNNQGEVSALCFSRPRPINMTKRVTWTTEDAAVTCERCLALLQKDTP